MINDGDLYENIMDKLKSSPDIDESNISIAINGDVVIIAGCVNSYTEKYLAEEAVEKIAQVKAIANELQVNLKQNNKRSDVDIAKAALNSLQWSTLVPSEKIKISVSDGHLILNGDVEFYFQRIRAEKAVHDLFGVTYITNNIKVKPTITPFQAKERIYQELKRNPKINANNILIELDGGEVTLKGAVKNIEEEREAIEAAWSVPGISDVISQLIICF